MAGIVTDESRNDPGRGFVGDLRQCRVCYVLFGRGLGRLDDDLRDLRLAPHQAGEQPRLLWLGFGRRLWFRLNWALLPSSVSQLFFSPPATAMADKTIRCEMILMLCFGLV